VADRLSGLDLSFLALETASTPMHLGAVLIFRAPAGAAAPDGARLTELLRHRVATVPRMRQRLMTAAFPPGTAGWVDDPGFDPAAHVQRSTVPTPGDQAQLDARVAALLAEPLPRTKPLWHLHVLDGLADASVVVLAKIHHAFADGIGALKLGFTLFDDPREVGGNQRPLLQLQPPAAAPPTGRPHELPRRGREFAGAAADALMTASLLIDPRTARGQWARHTERALTGIGIAASFLQALLDGSPAAPLTARHDGRRRFATLRADLDEVHQVRKKHGGTVHDVLLAVVAGALRCWLADRDQPADRPIRALVPTATRMPSSATASNQLSGYLLDLPIHLPDALRRLHTIRAAMAANKAAGSARGPGAFPQLADMLPPALPRLAAPLAAPITSRLFNTVITTVPLPERPITLNGVPLAELYPIVPIPPGHALGIAISAYRRHVHVGLHADHAAMPDLNRLAHHLLSALTELVTLNPAQSSVLEPRHDSEGIAR
jgi:WS/DGAT/MGAT family acyltransferase